MNVIDFDLTPYITGFLIMFAVYQFIVFLGREGDANYLYYVFYCIGFSLITIFKKLTPEIAIEGISLNTVMFLVGAHIAGFGIIKLLISFFLGKDKIVSHELYFPIFYGADFFLLLLLLVTKHNIFYVVNLIVMSILCLIAIMALIKHLVQYKKRDRLNNGQKIILVSLLITIIYFSVVCFLLAIFGQEYRKIVPYNVSMIIIGIASLLFSVAISIKFNQEHKELFLLKNNLEKTVEKRTQEIQNLSEQKTNMFINLAHETKTPLTLLKNSIESYIKKVKPDDELKICNSQKNGIFLNLVGYGIFS